MHILDVQGQITEEVVIEQANHFTCNTVKNIK